jgi:D-alanine-D-alanine ligase
MPLQAEPNIAVVCGGKSAEAAVSRTSGQNVAEALRAGFANVFLFELDNSIATSLLVRDIDVVFPALHGSPGEDGSFQGLLEIMDIPYVGSGVLASACAMNKCIAKQIFHERSLRTADYLVFRKFSKNGYTAEYITDTLGPEVVIKPVSQGSALGVRFAQGKKEISAALSYVSGFDVSVLVEKRIVGKEITVAVIERHKPEALPVIEIRTPGNTWYDYEHRYTPGLSEHIIPAGLPHAQYIKTQEMAILAHAALNCRDLSRADFIVPANEEPVLLELNTLPGMTPTSLYPDAAKASGISFESLVASLVNRALSRKKCRLMSPC